MREPLESCFRESKRLTKPSVRFNRCGTHPSAVPSIGSQSVSVAGVQVEPLATGSFLWQRMSSGPTSGR